MWNPFAPEKSVSDVAQPERWPVPDAATMEERRNRRRTMLRETEDHRRVHAHGGMSDTGRNIVAVLYDRERRGSSTLTVRRRRMAKRGSSQGDKPPSPSTVFESPVSATQADDLGVDVSRQPPEDGPAEEPVENDMLIDSPVATGLPDSIPSPEKLSLRRVTYPINITREIRTFGEYALSTKYHSAFLNHLGGDDALDDQGNRPASSRAVSTISVAFSPDGETMASTHGDHTVKISCCTTGRLLQSLDGHPRTPWTVKYHPKDPRIIASGCLGHQVRIWNWVERKCLNMIRLEFAIISLSFHPTGTVLAVANGTRLHFWGVDDVPQSANKKATNTQPMGSAGPRALLASLGRGGSRSSRLTEMDQRHMLRCVHFPPDGKTIIIGGVNPTTEDPRRRRSGIGGAGMSFYLRLWDFDIEKALEGPLDSPIGLATARRSISNPRTFVPRALLYNDGGFDVSPDGKTLCACAEYWLPEGVNNAMELLHREEMNFDADSQDANAEAAGDDKTADVAEQSSPDTHSAVSVALTKLQGITGQNVTTHGRSASFRDSMAESGTQDVPGVPKTPIAACPETPSASSGFFPRTPPVSAESRLRNLSPPPPPGSRFAGRRQTRDTSGGAPIPPPADSTASTPPAGTMRNLTTPPPPPPPPPPPAPGGMSLRPPHPLSVVSSASTNQDLSSLKGRYVPHVVTVSLDTDPLPEGASDSKLPRGKPLGAVALGYRPRLGQLLEACPLDVTKASAVTCVKFSPSTDFCLIGYGVREPVVEGGRNFHPVTAVYRIRGGMDHVSTMLSGDDDVNIARFHPESGHSFVYGTKQGRVRVLSTRPWNFYDT